MLAPVPPLDTRGHRTNDEITDMKLTASAYGT